MLDLFYQGGPLFMGILTLLLLTLVVLFVKAIMDKNGQEDTQPKSISLIRELGTLSLVTGILGQLIGFFSAFSIMEQADSISPSVLAGGLKISLITTIYGLLIFIIALIMVLFLRRKS